MVWFWLLGLSASVLAGREAGLPQQLPGPGATANQNVKNIPVRYIPFAGWRAIPAFGAMQEPIPDFRFTKQIIKTITTTVVITIFVHHNV